MKFIKHHLETITGIEIYPLISLCIFFAFFIGLLVYVWKMNRNYVQAMKNLPLDLDKE